MNEKILVIEDIHEIEKQRVLEAYDRYPSTTTKQYEDAKNTVPIVPKSLIGRNDPCSCGSGKKYKKCCL